MNCVVGMGFNVDQYLKRKLTYFHGINGFWIFDGSEIRYVAQSIYIYIYIATKLEESEI